MVKLQVTSKTINRVRKLANRGKPLVKAKPPKFRNAEAFMEQVSYWWQNLADLPDKVKYMDKITAQWDRLGREGATVIDHNTWCKLQTGCIAPGAKPCTMCQKAFNTSKVLNGHLAKRTQKSR